MSQPPLQTSSAAPRTPTQAVEECLEKTAAALELLGAATRPELTRAMEAVRQSHRDGHPGDLIEAIAHLQGNPPDKVGAVMAQLAERIAMTLNPSPSLIPFAGRLITPSAFYENFPEIKALSKALLSPLIYAEDTDAIGTASLNPIAASILAEEINHHVYERLGIRPFVTIALLEYDSWAALTRKHFER